MSVHVDHLPMLEVPVVLDGRPADALKLIVAGPRPDAVIADGGLVVDIDARAIRFVLGSERHVYLSSDGSTEFDLPPPESALALEGNQRGQLALRGRLAGEGEVSLWVIEYGAEERLRHWHTVLDPDGGRLDVAMLPETESLRVALRLTGSGTIALEELRIFTGGLPRALTVDACAFVAWPHARADGRLPEELPERLPVSAPAEAAPQSPENRELTVYLTVDTEDAYFTEPRLMTGAGIGREHGVWGIVDELDRRGLKGTFFVNVFEAGRQPPGAVRDLVRELHDRGHEVGLHTHPSPELDWYSAPLFRKSEREQAEILQRGRETLEEWTGYPVISFRAGGYAINDDTFPALAAAGILIDSSVFFASPNNHNSPLTVNAPRQAAHVVETPVTYVIRSDRDGRAIEHRKLDFDWLTVDELLDALITLRDCGCETATFMMHSFSFIDKASLPPEHERSPRARFTSPVLFNRFVEIYGPKPGARTAFAEFLDRLTREPGINVARMCDTHEQLLESSERRVPDVVPVVLRS